MSGSITTEARGLGLDDGSWPVGDVPGEEMAWFVM